MVKKNAREKANDLILSLLDSVKADLASVTNLADKVAIAKELTTILLNLNKANDGETYEQDASQEEETTKRNPAKEETLNDMFR